MAPFFKFWTAISVLYPFCFAAPAKPPGTSCTWIASTHPREPIRLSGESSWPRYPTCGGDRSVHGIPNSSPEPVAVGDDQGEDSIPALYPQADTAERDRRLGRGGDGENGPALIISTPKMSTLRGGPRCRAPDLAVANGLRSPTPRTLEGLQSGVIDGLRSPTPETAEGLRVDMGLGFRSNLRPDKTSDADGDGGVGLDLGLSFPGSRRTDRIADPATGPVVVNYDDMFGDKTAMVNTEAEGGAGGLDVHHTDSGGIQIICQGISVCNPVTIVNGKGGKRIDLAKWGKAVEMSQVKDAKEKSRWRFPFRSRHPSSCQCPGKRASVDNV
ncbi:predicted protein [Chaetomium globosum CBS 148.51]|uniref:Pectate lyase n=1 Tax=Chaetomium globosum (strain ATCC 6205 / CBS 148.51 / DSM 1962 / NBRC 6347 / NRRL 1970) TaxID=306901 RepID=Q2HFV7_CHAGB|nr:uncharacterized protein CHGG_00897 [Chaetomium globosum CBS 148.51]EAQ92662.1 predicted protein [Chaetomium globosum CBS 148.51]